MIRHCVLLTLAPDTDDARVAEMVEALRALPGQIDEIRSYEVGTDQGWREGNPEVGIVAAFDDEASWRAYLAHPAHLAALELIAANTTARTSIQFET